jgi:cell wall-associated NlpC family hydrolase
VALSYGAPDVNEGRTTSFTPERHVLRHCSYEEGPSSRMTIRHKVSTENVATKRAAAKGIAASVLAALASTAIAVGSVAPASAAPAAPVTASAPAYAITGADGLAGYANAALDAWVSYARTGSSRTLADFSLIRDAVAAEAARRLELDPAAMKAAWRRADSAHQVALLAAFTQLGTKYRRNAREVGVAFDCSGLTSWAWAQAGRELPRQSGNQIRNVAAVTRETVQAGDLAYYPGHISMYLGVGNAIIHAPFTGRNIEVGFFSKSRTNSIRFGNPVG